MSNAERQRKFQAAHPGYDRRRKSRERAGHKRAQERRLAALRAAALELRQQEAARTNSQLGAKPMLMLPAPVEQIEPPNLDEVRVKMQIRE